VTRLRATPGGRRKRAACKSRHNRYSEDPKILRVEDAEIVGDGRRESLEIPRHGRGHFGVYGGERAFPTSRLPHRQRSQGGFTRTVGVTDMPGPSSTMDGLSKVILTGMRCTTLT
jgi:hypothetical protein